MRTGVVVIVAVVIACGGRTDIGAAHSSDWICPPVAGPYFKIACEDDATTHVWHSIDSSLDPFAFDRVGPFSYDGKLMAVAEAGITHVFDGGGQQLRQQPSPPGIVVYSARPRCDGNRLMAFGFGTSGSDTSSRFGVLDPDGTYHELAIGRFIDAPVYGPDGRTLVFCDVTADATQFTIETMRDDGTERTNLVTMSAVVRWPSFSFDGTRIVYATLDGTTSGISMIDLASHANSAVIPADTFTLYGWPSFTPDGTGIVYVATLRSSGETDVRQIDLATHEQTTLISGPPVHNAINTGIYVAAD